VHARDYPSGQGTRSVFATDLDLDGDIDICAANSYDGTVTVFSNDGTGILSQSGVFAVGSFPMAVSASDLTGDGLPEIVVTNYISGTISILVNAGALVFGTATEIPTGLGPMDLALADLDGDGTVEIVTADYESGTITCISGGAPSTIATSGNPNAITVADLDSDGAKEIVAVYSSTGLVSVFDFDGAAWTESSIVQVSGHPRTVAAADLDLDGVVEILTAGFDDNILYVISSQDYSVGSIALGGVGPHSISIGDVDGNGLLDIAVALSSSYSVQVLGQDTAARADRRGHTAPRPAPRKCTPTGQQPGRPRCRASGTA
jgi:hypothetical protein